MIIQNILILIFLIPVVLTTTSESQMVNCAACAVLSHEPKAWECKVTCDIISEGGKGINITEISEEVKLLKAFVEELKNAPAYSFSAKTASNTAINENPVVFDEVGLNIGEAYDSTTGIFTAAVSGLHSFSSYATGFNDGYLVIKQNGNMLCRHWLTYDSWAQSDCTVVANLTAGDTVFVTGDSSNTAVLHLNGFTGHLVNNEA